MDELKEKKYMTDMIEKMTPEKYEFKVPFSEGKEIFGVIGDSDLGRFFEYKTLVKTYQNLHKKISFSLLNAIELAYTDEIQKSFDFFRSTSEAEFFCYYYIENAVFRTSTLWDMLAQFYNLHYNIGEDKGRIHYQKFFREKFNGADEKAKNLIEKINNYFNEEDDYSADGIWVGNHKYVKEYRNQMTHRNAPDEGALSNFDLNLKHHPSFLLKRVVEDFYIASQYIEEILSAIIDVDINKA